MKQPAWIVEDVTAREDYNSAYHLYRRHAAYL